MNIDFLSILAHHKKMFMSSNNNKNMWLWYLIHIYGNFMPLLLWNLFHILMSFMPYYTKLYEKADKLCAR